MQAGRSTMAEGSLSFCPLQSAPSLEAIGGGRKWRNGNMFPFLVGKEQEWTSSWAASQSPLYPGNQHWDCQGAPRLFNRAKNGAKFVYQGRLPSNLLLVVCRADIGRSLSLNHWSRYCLYGAGFKPIITLFTPVNPVGASNVWCGCLPWLWTIAGLPRRVPEQCIISSANFHHSWIP